ncbi:hypothetical protein [Mycoplasmopsis opalescens]|uniref:hypothetical protein n=1 Tax=Mycoplasmopsis opalescens TaxID=114886 RepID=UPI0004A6AE07|nr:hypothetical protein [Mycoplasmopsis opalescens]
MKNILATAYNKLVSILKNEEMFFSINTVNKHFQTKDTTIKNGELHIALWYLDFLKLKEKYPEFIFLESKYMGSLIPHFSYDGGQIYLDIIIGTNSNKLKKLDNPHFKKILKASDTSQKSFFIKTIYKNKKIYIDKIIELFADEKYTKLLILSDDYRFIRIYDNIDVTKMLELEVSGLKIPIFREIYKSYEEIS